MILAIESSCDESAVALFEPDRGMVGEWVHSQIVLHGNYGGVVPDLATREHVKNLGGLLEKARELSEGFSLVREVAVTYGPGLAGCLAIGLGAAKAMAWGLGVPLVGINHLRGHVFSPFIGLHEEDPGSFDERFSEMLPHLALVVSGGNTLLCHVDEGRGIQVISSTRDDAAGEALDKGAKLLGLSYPGGPLIEKLARKGDAAAFDFPRGIGRKGNLDFSFSGLKTSLRYQLEKMSLDEIHERMPDLAASYQEAVIDSLAGKAREALDSGQYRSLGLSGGVANNMALRERLKGLAEERDVKFLAAHPKHTGDNAGMIAFDAWLDRSAKRGEILKINPGLEIAG